MSMTCIIISAKVFLMQAAIRYCSGYCFSYSRAERHGYVAFSNKKPIEETSVHRPRNTDDSP